MLAHNSDRYGSQAEVKPPKADINRRRAYVGFVPIADTGPLLNNLIGCGEELGWDGQPKRFSSGMPRGKASGTLWHRAKNLNPRCRYRMLGPVTAPGLREKFKCRRRSILN